MDVWSVGLWDGERGRGTAVRVLVFKALNHALQGVVEEQEASWQTVLVFVDY